MYWKQTTSAFLFTATLTLTLVLALTVTFTSAKKTPGKVRVAKAQLGCTYKGSLYLPGSKFKASPCETCRCRKRGGVVNCIVRDCTPEPHCLKYARGSEKQCCPPCLEKGCRHTDGKIYQPGAVIRNEACVRCYCPLSGGEPVCDVTSCPMTECVDPVRVSGVCCPTCPNGPNCQIGLLTLPINQSVMIEGATCTCERFKDTDGVSRVLARCNKDRQGADGTQLNTTDQA